MYSMRLNLVIIIPLKKGEPILLHSFGISQMKQKSIYRGKP
jgi:hypothetical protein